MKAPQRKVGYDRNAATTTTTWLTPRPLIQALGPFDLDPCTPTGGMPWRTATRMLTPQDDGLATAWPKAALVWHNPPYGKGQDAWMRKAAEHGNGITLVLARTDTAWFHDWVFGHRNAHAVLFTRGRVQFCTQEGKEIGGCPTGAVFVAYGATAARRLKNAVAAGVIRGHYLDLLRAGRFDGAAANDDGGVAA